MGAFSDMNGLKTAVAVLTVAVAITAVIYFGILVFSVFVAEVMR